MTSDHEGANIRLGVCIVGVQRSGAMFPETVLYACAF